MSSAYRLRASQPHKPTRELLNTALHRRSPTSSVLPLSHRKHKLHMDLLPSMPVKVTPVRDRRRNTHVMSAPHLAGPGQSSSDLRGLSTVHIDIRKPDCQKPTHT